MRNAKGSAEDSADAVHPLVLERMEMISKEIADATMKNHYHLNYRPLLHLTPAVKTEVRIYLQNLGYDLETVYDGSVPDYVRISWAPKKPKKQSFLSRLFRK